MRIAIQLPALIILMCALLAFAGCVSDHPVYQESGIGEMEYNKGLAEYEAGNYRAAEAAFEGSAAWYFANGFPDAGIVSRNAMFSAIRTYGEFSLDDAAARDALKEAVPGITEEEIDAWLADEAQILVSDGQTLYFSDTAKNYLYAHQEILQKQKLEFTFAFMSRYALADDVRAGNLKAEDLPYRNPIHYEGTMRLEIAEADLPAGGTLKIWYPHPIETDIQRDVSVTNMTFPEYIVKGPDVNHEIGIIYYEIPVEAIQGDLVITADIRFTSYEGIFIVDPEKVGEYDTSDPEYILYTRSERNIEVNDAIRNKAREIVGSETNPHKQAQMIYEHIITTYPYSHVPHMSLDTKTPKVAESTHMFTTGHGDCGTQSMLFSAFCRSLGIPARATGGYQMLLKDAPSPHFWAEYYLPEYGWVPVDPTVADGGDWFDIPEDDRIAFRRYYGTNIDPTRLVIQKNVDATVIPDYPKGAVIFRLCRQYPAIVSDTSMQDMELIAMGSFRIDLVEKD
ncbi:transglutaminase domain-containing protein [Methanocalculus taiwanensis]|uniref:Transglutaminase domain-containing protein n=1 Tax=Methanocalculus taiwanensis TaxID=106207 RepID=A0ABD4TKQ6_9EURY|nr:transglutaminase-like domain-containing protein [Methanocalculus taiwanensis]MCQ1538117.1 transglutaminase domain-containing protein [Methanocalculus taiwanensis]